MGLTLQAHHQFAKFLLDRLELSRAEQLMRTYDHIHIRQTVLMLSEHFAQHPFHVVALNRETRRFLPYIQTQAGPAQIVMLVVQGYESA